VCDSDVGKKFKKVVECDQTLPVGEGVKLPPRAPLKDLFPETRGPVVSKAKEDTPPSAPAVPPEEPSSAVVDVPSAAAPVTVSANVDAETLQRAEKRVARAESQLETARNSLAASQQTLDSARSDLAKVKGSIQDSESGLAKLRTEVDIAVAQRTKAIADERDAVARNLTGDELFRLQAARQSAETIADRLQEQVKTLEKQLEDSSFITKQIADLEALTAQFEADVDAARQEVQNAEAEYARAQEQLDNLLSGKATGDATDAFSQEQQDGAKGLSTWTIALIVVGSVLLFVLVLLATFFLARRKNDSVAGRKTSPLRPQGSASTAGPATMPKDNFNY